MPSEKQLREFGHQIWSLASKLMSREGTCEAYRQIILNEQPELQQGAFLMAHIVRGPSVEEISGVWDALDRYDMTKIRIDTEDPVCDIVGTGAEALKTAHCFTPAAFIASACGLRVAKKGTKLLISVSDASDILEILGIDLGLPLSHAKKCLEKHGICYLPEEAFFKSGWIRLRRDMCFTSVFDIIGPLTRPCEQTDTIVIGAYAPDICDQMITVLREIGISSAISPFGMAEGEDEDKGMDKFSLSGPTRVAELKNDSIRYYEVTPEDFGLRTAPFSKIAGSNSAQENARRISDVLEGQYDTPDADFFCMNAAAALYISGMAESYAGGMEKAKQALADGKALEKLEKLREFQGTGG